MADDVGLLADRAIELTRELLRSADAAKTHHDERQAKLMAQMLERPANLSFTLQLADQVFRPRKPQRVAELLDGLVERHGLPTFLSAAERAAFSIGLAASRRVARLVVPAIRRQVRAQSADLILDAGDRSLTGYLERAERAGMSVNVNLLGEAVLGDREAEARMQRNLAILRRSDVTHMSVKISSVVGRLRPIAFEHSVDVIAEQLRRLYREASAQDPPVFVNLDMEAYEDLDLTLTSFRKVLTEDEFLATYAGVVLQAYLPDSHGAQHDLTQWALERRRHGGAPIRVRLVKGANLGMERVTAELNGWTQAPYGSKHESDASFKKMVLYGLGEERTEAVHLGIASHNLFDVAFAHLAAVAAGVTEGIEYEMLQGMASHQARAVNSTTGKMLLYAPIVGDEDFVSAVAYLSRRLEENTEAENYLRHVFSIRPDGPVFETEATKFRRAVAAIAEVESRRGRRPLNVDEGRFNAANSDFTNPATRARLSEALASWQAKEFDPLPLVIGGVVTDSSELEIGRDPSRPEHDSYRYSVATQEHVETALATANRAEQRWSLTDVDSRRALLLRAADLLEESRWELVGCMARDGGKRAVEADAEVSEAVDMGRYYADAFADLEMFDCRFEPLGTVVVAPPWNFPIAIPAGGVLAALMAGNTVLLKPAPQAVLSGWVLANILWDAGIPADVLQFIPTRDDEVGKRLIMSADGVILTGAWETGRLFTSWKPDLRLFAETSGKNSMTITATADLDQAIADLVDSAFGHAGQKCSAASLALVEAEVFDAPEFRRQLADAVESLTVGPAWDVSNDVTSLIGPPGPALTQGLTTLEPGEEWLVAPKPTGGGGWSPGVRLGVTPGSFLHRTECFGPILGIMRVETLDQAIDIANSSEFGLTGGLHSLDDDEIARWVDRIEVGNAYVNRTTTGAIVRRQPFGGWKKSVFGPGAKAGGPNYVLQFGTWREATDDDASRLASGRRSFRSAWETHFNVEHDPSSLRSESNIFRYRRPENVILRVAEGRPEDVALAREAAEATGVSPLLSVAPEMASTVSDGIVEDSEEFAVRLAHTEFARVRYLGRPSEREWRAARASHSHIADDPVLAHGRLELRHYLREQSVTRTLHRHGMLPAVDREM